MRLAARFTLGNCTDVYALASRKFLISENEHTDGTPNRGLFLGRGVVMWQVARQNMHSGLAA